MKKALLFLILGLIFYTTSQAQDNDALRKKIAEAYSVFSNAEWDRFGEFMTDDFIEHSPSPGQKPGLAGLKEMFIMMKKAYPDMKITINDIIIDPSGRKAAVLFSFQGTNTGEWIGMPPTNKKVDVMGIDWLVLNENMKATEHWGYIDVESMMKQLGLTGEHK